MADSISRRVRWALAATLLICCVGCDQATKHLATETRLNTRGDSVANKKTVKKAVEEENRSEKPTVEAQLDHGQFRKGGVLSLFLGSFKSEEELDAYLSETFPTDFGFTIDSRDGPEVYVAPNPSCPEADLLKGFSRSVEFVEPVTKALATDGWHRSDAAVVFYNFCYDPKAYRLFNGWGRLKFMGTYLFKEKTWVPFRNG